MVADRWSYTLYTRLRNVRIIYSFIIEKAPQNIYSTNAVFKNIYLNK